MKLLTYNIYFDSKEIETRTKYIIHHIYTSDYDIVTLQEVTQYTFHLIQTSNLKEKYILNKSAFNEQYGCLILVKRGIKILEFNIVPYQNSLMGRCLEFVRLDNDIIIGTTHLESEFRDIIKKKDQFNFMFNYMDGYLQNNYRVIITGDMNIKETETTFPVPSNYIDVFNGFSIPVELSYTYDCKRNKMIKGRFRSRLDRIYTSHNIAAISYEQVGTQPINNIGTIYPSDHFGIAVELVV